MCGGEIGDMWCKGRKLQYYCYDEDCGWEDEERIPEKREVTNTKTCFIDGFSGWDYTIYDKYGHTMVLSRTYDSSTEAMKELEKELLRGEKDEAGGPYTGVLFKTPSQITITGEMYKVKKGQIKRTMTNGIGAITKA